MYNTIKDLLDAYRAAPEILQALLHNYSPEQATAAHGGDEGWSVVEVICHLRDSEEVAIKRTRLMRDGTNPEFTSRDPNKLAIEKSYATTSLDSALDSFLQLRATHLQELIRLRAEEWEHTGQHDNLGVITISGQIAHLVAHDAIHLAQISRQLGQIA